MTIIELNKNIENECKKIGRPFRTHTSSFYGKINEVSSLFIDEKSSTLDLNFNVIIQIRGTEENKSIDKEISWTFSKLSFDKNNGQLCSIEVPKFFNGRGASHSVYQYIKNPLLELSQYSTLKNWETTSALGKKIINIFSESNPNEIAKELAYLMYKQVIRTWYLSDEDIDTESFIKVFSKTISYYHWKKTEKILKQENKLNSDFGQYFKNFALSPTLEKGDSSLYVNKDGQLEILANRINAYYGILLNHDNTKIKEMYLYLKDKDLFRKIPKNHRDKYLKEIFRACDEDAEIIFNQSERQQKYDSILIQCLIQLLNGKHNMNKNIFSLLYLFLTGNLSEEKVKGITILLKHDFLICIYAHHNGSHNIEVIPPKSTTSIGTDRLNWNGNTIEEILNIKQIQNLDWLTSHPYRYNVAHELLIISDYSIQKAEKTDDKLKIIKENNQLDEYAVCLLIKEIGEIKNITQDYFNLDHTIEYIANLKATQYLWNIQEAINLYKSVLYKMIKVNQINLIYDFKQIDTLYPPSLRLLNDKLEMELYYN